MIFKIFGSIKRFFSWLWSKIKNIFNFGNREKVYIILIDPKSNKLNKIETMDRNTITFDESIFASEASKELDCGSDVDLETLDVEVDVEKISKAIESSDDESLEIPKVPEPVEKFEKPVRDMNEKLKWEPKASVPKYALGVNSNLNAEMIKKINVTRQGKAEALAKEKILLNQSKARLMREEFKKEVTERRIAGAEERARKVAMERKRVEEAKKRKELEAEKIRQKAIERTRLEKEMRVKEKAAMEAKRLEVLKAKEEAFRTSKGAKC